MEDSKQEVNTTLMIEKAKVDLNKILVNSLMFAFKKGYTKELVRLLCTDLENRLREAGASENLIQSSVYAIKQTFMRQYLLIVAQLEEMQKKAEKRALGVIGNTIANMKSNEPLDMSGGGALVIADLEKMVSLDDNLPLDKGKQAVIGIASANVDNIRDYMTTYDLGALGRQVEYTDELERNMIAISNQIADGKLTMTDSLGRTKSTRNMAEIETRYALVSKDLLKATANSKYSYNGKKLVVASSHADASERCSWWQGKVFVDDLDDINNRPMGEYKGKPNQTIVGEIDGKKIYSLKQACECGFLSYNCQHHLVAYYKGVEPPVYNSSDINRKRDITTKQRQLENTIRKYKGRETNAKVIPNEKKMRTIRVSDWDGSNQWAEHKETKEMTEIAFNKAMSKYYQEYYKWFSKKNNVPEYRWRTKIGETERNV